MTAHAEVSHHYNGEATVSFTPGNHAYIVTDEKYGRKKLRAGGGTSITGVLSKGDALAKWPVFEMAKHLRQRFSSMTLKQLIDGPETLEDMIVSARQAADRKSQRGMDVGTNAHQWVEDWNKATIASYESGEFNEPAIPDVQHIADTLRESYIRIINTLKPYDVAEWRQLPDLIAKDIDIQEGIWIEANMARNAIMAAKAWLDRHEIIVHGAEDTVYSREMFICGRYDADWTVTCSKTCGWCYLNVPPKEARDQLIAAGIDNVDDFRFTGRYVTDFKSSNSSSAGPKGVYPEYLVQCAVYYIGITEEFPERIYNGFLILNGAKEQREDKNGNKYPLFNSHFSFDIKRHTRTARNLAVVKEDMWQATKEIEASR